MNTYNKATANLQMVAEAGNTATFFETYSHDVTLRTTGSSNALVIGNTAEGGNSTTAACYVDGNRVGINKRPALGVRLDVSGRIVCADDAILCSEEDQVGEDVPSVPRAEISSSNLTLHWAPDDVDKHSRVDGGLRSDVVMDGRGTFRSRCLIASGTPAVSGLVVSARDADVASGHHGSLEEGGHPTSVLIDSVDATGSNLRLDLSASNIHGSSLSEKDLDLISAGDVLGLGDTAYSVLSKTMLHGSNGNDDDGDDSGMSMRLMLRDLLSSKTTLDPSLRSGSPARLMRLEPDDRDSRWTDRVASFEVGPAPETAAALAGEAWDLVLTFEDGRFSQAMLLLDGEVVALGYKSAKGSSSGANVHHLFQVHRLERQSTNSSTYDLVLRDLSGGNITTKTVQEALTTDSFHDGSMGPVRARRPDAVRVREVVASLSPPDGVDVSEENGTYLKIALPEAEDDEDEEDRRLLLLNAIDADFERKTSNPLRTVLLLKRESSGDDTDDTKEYKCVPRFAAKQERAVYVLLEENEAEQANATALVGENQPIDVDFYPTGFSLLPKSARTLDDHHVVFELEQTPDVSTGARKALRSVIPRVSVEDKDYESRKTIERGKADYEITFNNGPFASVKDDGTASDTTVGRTWLICEASEDLKTLVLRRKDGRSLPGLPEGGKILPGGQVYAIPVEQERTTTLDADRMFKASSTAMAVGKHALPAPDAALSVFGDLRVDHAMRFCGEGCTREWRMSLEGDDLELDSVATLSGNDAHFHNNVHIANQAHAKLFKTVSDSRFKVNVENIPIPSLGDQHSALMSVPIHRFSYVDPVDERTWHTGVLAQELKQSVPNAVTMHSSYVPIERPVVLRVATSSSGPLGTVDVSADGGWWGRGQLREGDKFKGFTTGSNRPIGITVKRVPYPVSGVRVSPLVEVDLTFPLLPLSTIVMRYKLQDDVHSVDTNELLYSTIASLQHINARLRDLEGAVLSNSATDRPTD